MIGAPHAGRRLLASVPRAELEEGKPRRLRHPPFHVLVIVLEGEVLAIEDTCNHGHASLAKGTVLPDACIACPLHGYVFSLRSGELKRPLHVCGPQRRFDTECVDGMVHVYEAQSVSILAP